MRHGLILIDELKVKMRKSQRLALIAVFATLSVVCDSLAGLPQLTEGVWYGWIFIITPITGIVLGPYEGFLATLIGVMIGHSIYPRGSFEYLFTLGAPIGSMVSALISRKKWKIVLIYYSLLFTAYFSSPIAWQLPLWGMWDTYIAYAALMVLIIIWKSEKSIKIRERSFYFPLYALIGLEADILFRIFIFIPCRTYSLFYGFPIESLKAIWVAGAVVTPIQVAVSSVVTTAVVPYLMSVLPSRGWFISEKR